MMSANDEQLKRLRTELKDTARSLVIPVVLSLGVALQTFIPTLEPLRPFGWFGCVHCIPLFLAAIWQDTPDLQTAMQRSRYREPLYLLLSTAGFAACASCLSGQDKQLLHVILFFVLPVAATREVVDMELSHGASFHTYLALHFAMTCAEMREDFWIGGGWQLCLASLLLDCLLLGVVHDRARGRKELLETTCGTVRRLLSMVCDGCCVLSITGDIVMSEERLAELLVGGANQEDQRVDGQPFQDLLVKDSGGEPTSLREGFAMGRLKLAHGGNASAELCTVRCAMSQEALCSILGKQGGMKDSGVSKAPGTPDTFAYLRLVRWASSHAEGLPELSVPVTAKRPTTKDQLLGGPRHGTASSLSASRLRDFSPKCLGRLRANSGSELGVVSEVGVRSEVSSRCSNTAILCRPALLASDIGRRSEVDHCSELSASSLDSHVNTESAQTLANRRLQLMRCAGPEPFVAAKRGTAVILEMDLPISEVNSVVSEAHTGVAARGSTEAYASPIGINVRMRMGAKAEAEAVNLPGDDDPPLGAVHRASDPNDEEAEETQQVVSLEMASGAADGHVRVKMQMRSPMLAQQQARLDSSELELQSVRRDLHAMDEVQEEQKTVLRKFQKIVTREFGNSSEGMMEVSVFLFEERAAIRAELQQLCRKLGFPCQAFETIEAGRAALEACAFQGKHRNGGLGFTALPAVSPLSGTLRQHQHAQLVLVGAPLLVQLPAKWRQAGFFITLVSNAEEFEDVGHWMGAFGTTETREKLRALGVMEYVEWPVGADSLRGLADGALQHHYGGDYLLVEQLGSGATATVYSGKRLRDGEVFALKVIKLAKVMTGDPVTDVKKDALREAEILGALRWPTVLPAIDHWHVGGKNLLYILTPALEGGTIYDRVEAAIKGNYQDIPIERAAQWYAQTLHALTYLHWCGVLHRDIKPENMLLDANGLSLRICDFGNAILLTDPRPHPARREFVQAGVTTPRITSPEVFARQVCYPASDLWSVGATFYEVLSLQPLMPKGKPTQQIRELMSSWGTDPGFVGNGGGSDAGAGPPPGLAPGSLKLLEQVPSNITSDLAELLRWDPLRRPSAASLVTRPHIACYLRLALEAGSFWDRAERDQHLKDLDKVASESEAAAEL